MKMCWSRKLVPLALLCAVLVFHAIPSSAHFLEYAADESAADVDRWFGREELTPEVRDLMSLAAQRESSMSRRRLLAEKAAQTQCVWLQDSNECQTNASTVFTTITIPTNVGDLRTRFWNCFNTNNAGCVQGTSPEYCATRFLVKVTTDNFPISGNVCLPRASPITTDSDLEDLLDAKNTVDTRCTVQTVSRECMIAFTTEMHYMGCGCDDTLKQLIAVSDRCFYSDQGQCTKAELAPTGCPVCDECTPIQKQAGSVTGFFFGGVGAAALLAGVVYLFMRWRSKGHAFSFLTSTNRHEHNSGAFEPTQMGMGSPSAFAQGSDGRNWFTSKKSSSVQYTTSNAIDYAPS